MGEVYLVENVELNKQLVIKVLLPGRSSDAELVERFLAEARAASAIRHRHIVEVLDSSTLADGRPYILMEYLEGETLFSFNQRKGLASPEITLAIMAQVLSGLEAAHKRGVIHRDIKPSNVYIAPQPDNHYFTKILDFGIAKLEDPRLSGGVQTRSVMIAGTPHYMSPEQARTLHGVDHRTDIYAVGVMAYEMLTGRVPYDAHSIGDLVYQQTRTTPPMVHTVRPDVPLDLSQILAQAMDLEPDARPASARELAMLLIAATPDGTRIAKEAAPLLFTRAGTTSGQVGVPLSEVEAQVSEIRSEPPHRRRMSSMPLPSAPGAELPGAHFRTGTTSRPPTAGPRGTEILPEGARRTASQAMQQAIRPTTGSAIMRAAEPPARPAARPSMEQPVGPTGTQAIAAPNVAPIGRAASQISRQAPVLPSPPTTPAGERKRSNMRLLLIVAVLVTAIAAAIAIGLFTGPQKLGNEGDNTGEPTVDDRRGPRR